MSIKIFGPLPLGQGKAVHRICPLSLAAVLVVTLVLPAGARAQTAMIGSSWWTYQQDCNGDGCYAGQLPGNHARLNWSPVVQGCNGTLNVFEIVYWSRCDAGKWTAVFTNAPHSITGCRSTGDQSTDIHLDNSCGCWDYKIELYQVGQTVPDDIHSNTNDPVLAHHQEQTLAQDYCLSDFFATCASLSGCSGSYADNNTYATKETGEPNHAGNPGGKSLWYCWTAPTNFPVTFNTLGSTFDTLLAVYTGNSVSNLTLVAANDDIAGWTNRLSSVTFIPTTGTTYHIAVDGFGGASGIVLLNWNQTGAALPDLIIYGPAASPTVITRTFTNTDCEVVEGCETPGTHRLLSFTTETRNIGGGDLIMGDPATNSLFYWATCHQHFHFESFAEYNLLDASNNIVATGHKVGFCLEDVHSWSATANPEKRYNCSYQGIQSGWADVYAAGLPCQYIDVTAVPPGNYVLQMIVNPDNLIAEADTSNNETRVPVTIPPTNCLTAPDNDDFTNPVVISQTPFSYSEFNTCATNEAGEPDSGGHSVWFSWTPAANQTVVINTKNSDFDTILAVYTGNNVSNLSLVASNDDIILNVYKQSQVSFAAVAGTTYQIDVDGYGGAVGTMVLNVDPPANDDFGSPIILSGVSGQVTGSNFAASKQPFERAHAGDVGGHSVWYQWTAPASGPVDINTVGSTYNTTLAVYTGTVLTNLNPIASNIDDPEGSGLASRVDFWALADTTYLVAIDGFGGAAGNFTLTWNMDSSLTTSGLTNGTMQLNLTGVDWQRYTVFGSLDFLAWSTNVPTFTMMGGAQQFTSNPPTNNLSHRQFFRARREQ